MSNNFNISNELGIINSLINNLTTQISSTENVENKLELQIQLTSQLNLKAILISTMLPNQGQGNYV